MGDCKNCGNKLICPYCKREFTKKSGFIVHMKYCEKNNLEEFDLDKLNNPGDTDQVLVNDPTIPVIEHINDLDDDVRNFINSFKGRAIVSKYDVDIMFSLFRRIYNSSNLHLDHNCSACISQVYRRILDYYEKIK